MARNTRQFTDYALRLPATGWGRWAAALLIAGLAAALLTSWLGAAFRLAALLLLAGLAATLVAVRHGERSPLLLLPALLVAIIAVAFAVAGMVGAM